MNKGKRLSVDEAAQKIGAIVEKHLDRYSEEERKNRLEEMHRIASNAAPSRRKKSASHAETPAHSL
jgi:hypothetical protein